MFKSVYIYITYFVVCYICNCVYTTLKNRCSFIFKKYRYKHLYGISSLCFLYLCISSNSVYSMHNDSESQPLRTKNPCVTYKERNTIKPLMKKPQKGNPGFRDDMYFSAPWGYSRIYTTKNLLQLCATTGMLGAVGGGVCTASFLGSTFLCTQTLDACGYIVGGMVAGTITTFSVGTCVVALREVEDRYCLDCSKALMAKRAKQMFQCGCHSKENKPVVSQPKSVHESFELTTGREGDISGREGPSCEELTRVIVHGNPFEGKSENGFMIDTCSIQSQESSFLEGVKQLFSHGSDFFLCGGSREDFEEPQDADESSLFGLQKKSMELQQNEEEGEDRERTCSDPWISRPVITTQPRALGASLSTTLEKVTSVFVPEHSVKGQIHSLQALQTALVDASEYVSSTLKFLTVTMYKHTNVYPEPSHTIEGSPSMLRRHQRRSPISYSQASSSVHLFETNQLVAFIDKQTINVEQKVGSGRFGVISQISPQMHIGLAYSRGQEMSKEHRGIDVDKGIGSANTRTKTDGLSGIIAWNIRDVGFTVYCAGCYDTGTIMNVRYSTYGNQCMKTKGNPTITMTGGLFQLGYTIPIFQSAFLKPYIESIHSRVTWKTYEETYGPLPCIISSNTENVWEQRIGLHSHWKVSEVTQLQAWIANVFGHRTIHSLRSRPLYIPTELAEVFIPRQHRKYRRIEIGIAHDAILGDSITLRLHGNVYRTNARKLDIQQIGCCLMYQY